MGIDGMHSAQFADSKTIFLAFLTFAITIILTFTLFISLTIVISDASPILNYQTSFPYTIYFIVFVIVAINIQKVVAFIIMEYVPKKEIKENDSQE